MSFAQIQERLALLTVEEMYRADALAIAAGVSGETLMENAGRAVAEAVARRWAARPVLVLCGPGNNGGDGFVAARHLRRWGWPVTLALLGSRDRLTGDAALHAARWNGATVPLTPPLAAEAGLVVDALFGAGLTRPVEGMAAAVLDEVAVRKLPCVAVDVPSGVHGDSGEVLGTAIQAALTVTFFRRKPGHLLLPGRALCGEQVVADIGIPERVLDEIAPRQHVNEPGLWLARFPRPGSGSHKYKRGHAVVVGGEQRTGAARLAARAAMRVGAGLVTVASPPAAVPIYAAAMPNALVDPLPDAESFAAQLADARKNAILLGPGGGVGDIMTQRVVAALATDRTVVLDADALTAFQGRPDALFAAVAADRCLLTPHDGEFARLFDRAGDKLTRTRAAAVASRAAVLLKGADTVIAAPDGRAAINANAPPQLATAGTGDVLAGLAVGLAAQGMAPFDAGCAAAWLHGAAAAEIGPGLIAEDLPEALTAVLEAPVRHENVIGPGYGPPSLTDRPEAMGRRVMWKRSGANADERDLSRDVPANEDDASMSPQPTVNLFDRTWSSLRQALRDITVRRNLDAFAPRADLPDADAAVIREQMQACLDARDGEVSARSRAAALGRAYLALNRAGRKRYLQILADEFDVDRSAVDSAIEALRGAQTPEERHDAEETLRLSLQAPRVRLLTQFNALPEGVKFLVDLRAELMEMARTDPGLKALEADLRRLLASWFDVGFLELHRITWRSPAALLEKLIDYEAVHEIRGWTDLKNRLDSDRRCYAFFHPRMPDEPLIFVEIALVTGMADNVNRLLDENSPVGDPNAADSAIFYSISNAQKGLAGISFGNFLIKRVVDDLAREFKSLKTFATLSPIPGFGGWLRSKLEAEGDAVLLDAERRQLEELLPADGVGPLLIRALAMPDWPTSEALAGALKAPLTRLCAQFLLQEKRGRRALDPVAHFHLSNGARMERLNWLGDVSPKGLQQAAGLMINYLYKLDSIEANLEGYTGAGKIACSSAIRGQLKS